MLHVCFCCPSASVVSGAPGDHIKKLLMQAVQSFASHLVWILDCAATALKIGSLSGLRSSLLRSDRQIRAGTDSCRRYVCFSPGSEESATPSHSKHWSSLVHPFSSYVSIYEPVRIIYRTAENIGGQLNLAVWRLGKRPSNLNPSILSAIYATYILFYACACAHIICTELPPNLNPPIFLFRPLRTKPPNLKIANISGYTV